jgi:energy-coupling factor transporter ATP-binding protein EcfA2
MNAPVVIAPHRVAPDAEGCEPVGQVLPARGAVTREDVAEARAAQGRQGGRLGDILVSMGKVEPHAVAAAMEAMPAAPATLADTGIALADLIDLLTKTMVSGAVDTIPRLAGALKLSAPLVRDLLQAASGRMLIETLGASGMGGGMGGGPGQQPRYALSARGRDRAQQALGRNGYVGPVPVALADYADRIRRQSIGTERIRPEALARALSGLVGAERLVAQLGPAINSGRSILLYGPAGNGKSTVARLLGSIFETTIYVPHAFETGGQIVRVFDPGIHREVPSPEDAVLAASPASIRAPRPDSRWVPCARPFVVTGGELTPGMLDPGFDPVTRVHEAPLHIKALNGLFLVDDFGRQGVRPEALLNRWIVPMDSRVDHLRLQGGTGFSLPFDGLVVFSTHLAPHQLMDPAFLRRIPYKIELRGPTEAEFVTIFRRIAEARGLHAPEAAIAFLLRELRAVRGLALAGYQPGFIVEQVLAACRFRGTPAQLDEAAILAAIDNLDARETPPG